MAGRIMEKENKPEYFKITNGTYVFWFIIIFVLSISTIKLYYGFSRSYGECAYSRCTYSLEATAQALKLYADENEGKYPERLTLLTPGYLKEIPECEGYKAKLKFLKFNRLKYEDTYTVSNDFKTYTFYCPGGEHDVIGLPDNYPQYTSDDGLIYKP